MRHRRLKGLIYGEGGVDMLQYRSPFYQIIIYRVLMTTVTLTGTTKNREDAIC